MDNQQRKQLFEKALQLGWREPDWRHQTPLPLVSLEDFFVGNDDQYSISVNLTDHPGLEAFYEILKQLRAKAGIRDVLVEIYYLPENETEWALAEKVFVITDAEIVGVAQDLKQLQPSDEFKCEELGLLNPIPAPPENSNIYVITWD